MSDGDRLVSSGEEIFYGNKYLASTIFSNRVLGALQSKPEACFIFAGINHTVIFFNGYIFFFTGHFFAIKVAL